MKPTPIKMTRPNFFTTLAVTLVGVFLASLPGCSGGGSAGTGTTLVQGTLRSTENQPLTDIAVTIPGTSDNGRTDSDGHFSIDSTRDEDQLTISVTVEGRDAAVEVTDIPPQADIITIDLSFAAASGVLTADNINFEEREGKPRPHRSPTPTPDSSLTDSSSSSDEGFSSSSDDEVVPEPTEFPTPTVEPTESPTPPDIDEPEPEPTSFPSPTPLPET